MSGVKALLTIMYSPRLGDEAFSNLIKVFGIVIKIEPEALSEVVGSVSLGLLVQPAMSSSHIMKRVVFFIFILSRMACIISAQMIISLDVWQGKKLKSDFVGCAEFGGCT